MRGHVSRERVVEKEVDMLVGLKRAEGRRKRTSRRHDAAPVNESLTAPNYTEMHFLKTFILFYFINYVHNTYLLVGVIKTLSSMKYFEYPR